MVTSSSAESPATAAAGQPAAKASIAARLRAGWVATSNSFNESGRRTKIGVTVSVLYLLVLTITVAWRFQEFADLPLNALGDFLAGSFAPLAFMWLVLGYSQQGDELRQNGQALQLQAQELHHSVEEQRALVAVAREEHMANTEAIRLQREQWEAERRDAERARQPLFQFHAGSTHTSAGLTTINLTVTNLGGDCADVGIATPEDPEVALRLSAAPGAFTRYSSRNGQLQLPAGRDVATTVWIRYRFPDGSTWGTEYVIEADADRLLIKPVGSGGPTRKAPAAG